MTDHIETLRHFLETGPVSFVAGKQYVTVPADELRAALSAREGGVVVAWAFEQDDGWGDYEKRLAYSKEAGERPGCRNLRALFDHPAQPASQQGEKVEDGMLPDTLAHVSSEWYELCERAAYVDRIKISGELAVAIVATVCRQANPTGDRVRAVLEAADAWWRMKKPLAYSDAEHAANPVINCCTDTEKALAIAAAALDQEKGR